MDREYAEYLLQKTKEDYNLIAEDFSNTRSFLPEDVKQLAQYAKQGDRILDLGCGNGRLIELFKDKKIDYIGVDISEKLIGIARNKYPQGKFTASSALSLPFPDNYFDKVYCLAVFHHVPSEDFRLMALQEIRRILKPAGLLILTVWNLNPFRMLLIGKKKRAVSFFKYLILKILGKSKIDFNDFFIPWGKSCQRYIHCFNVSELERLAKGAGLKIKEAGVSKSPATKESSIYLIAEK